MVLGAQAPGRVGRRRFFFEPPSGAALFVVATLSCVAGRARTSGRKRLPSGHVTGPLPTAPARGHRLEAVLAEGGEIDREIDGAEDPVGEDLTAGEHQGSEARKPGGQNIRSAQDLAPGRTAGRGAPSATPAEAVRPGRDDRQLLRRRGSTARAPAAADRRGCADRRGADFLAIGLPIRGELDAAHLCGR